MKHCLINVNNDYANEPLYYKSYSFHGIVTSEYVDNLYLFSLFCDHRESLPEYEVWQIMFPDFRISIDFEHLIRLSVDSREEDKNTVGIRPCRNHPQYPSPVERDIARYRRLRSNIEGRWRLRTWTWRQNHVRAHVVQRIKRIHCARRRKSDACALAFFLAFFLEVLYIINNNHRIYCIFIVLNGIK